MRSDVTQTSSIEERLEQLAFQPGRPLALGQTDENPRDIGLLDLLREDFETHGSSFRAPGFWALAVHRIGNWRMGIRKKALRIPLTAVYRVAYQGCIALWGIDLPYNAKIGRRLRISHHGCLFLGARVVGDDVHIESAATIGLARRSDRSSAPTIGNGVRIGPRACIVGPVHVGDGCYVGPSTVLGDNVPAGCAVIGVPARIITLEELQQLTAPGTLTARTALGAPSAPAPSDRARSGSAARGSGS